ncbi:hypothetical protein D3C80_1323630 [compost metagenome]
MNNFKAQDKALKAARAAVNALPFGTSEWEAAMQIVRDLCEKANAADNAILNHRCDFSR